MKNKHLFKMQQTGNGEVHLSVEKTSRYFIHGPLSSKTTDIWMVLHGYGQLAEYFIRKFRILVKNEKTSVIAPEGLHRFYLSGQHGRVGASWMTKEDREHDISDYIRWLDLVYEDAIRKAGHDQFRLHLLGFSQGTATAGRWCADGNANPDNLVLWAGLLPPDLSAVHLQKNVGERPIYLVYGDADPYRDKGKEQERMQPFHDAGLNIYYREYKGDHRIDEDMLEGLNKEINA